MTEQSHLPFQPKRTTKRDLLRNALMSGRRLSKQEILREFGIWNSGHIVWLLRGEGIKVETEMVTHGENTFAVYFVAPTGKESDDCRGVTVGAKGALVGLNL